MKFVKEHIYEKFSEKSDPVEDLSIGIKHEYEKWLEEFKQSNRGVSWNLNVPNSQLMAVSDQGKTEFVEYLIKKLGADPNFDNVASLRIAAYQGNLETGVELVKHGANLEMAVKHSKKWNHNDTILRLNKIEGMLNKLVNEKFTPDSDPILDMGIGAIKQLIKNLWKLQKTEGVGALNLNSHQGTYYIHISYYDGDAVAMAQRVRDLLGKDRFKTMGSTRTSFGSYQFTGIIKPEYVDLFKQAFTPQGYIKMITEKFEETTDPLEDLGIGGKKEFDRSFKEFIRTACEGFWTTLSSINISTNLNRPCLIIHIMHDPYNDNFKPSYNSALITSGFDKFIEKITRVKTNMFSDDYLLQFKPQFEYIIGGIKEFKKERKFLKGRFFKNQQMYTYEVEIMWKDEINEKFIQHSDPIQDMNIGSEEIWKKLKEGDALKVLNWVNVSHPEDSIFKITRILNRTPDQLLFNYENFYDEKDFLKKNKRDGIKGSWTITYDFFKNNLQLIEHVNEKFTAESDPIRDLGIGTDAIVQHFLDEIKEKWQLYDYVDVFKYYPKEKFIRIDCWRISITGILALIKILRDLIPKYKGILKITQMPNRTLLPTPKTRDAIIRVL